MWGLHVLWAVVSAAASSMLGRGPHHREGVASHCTGYSCWGSGWKGLTVTCWCDNAAVVALVNSGRSKIDRAMHLMRYLSFFLAKWGVSLLCRHILGTQNGAAEEDVLCRFIAKMASEGLKHRTIKSNMTGIRHLHVEEGLGYPFLPTLPRLHYMLRGVKRSQREECATGMERLPITPPLLR